jgi:Protein export membrane protein
MGSRPNSFLRVLVLGMALWAPLEAGVQTSQKVFFPKGLGEKLEAYTSFPLTWWNFLSFDLKDDTDFSYLRTTCTQFRAETRDLVALLACGDDLEVFQGWVKEWARDYALRESKPSDLVLKEKLQGTLSRASLPLPPSLMSILRVDPLASYRTLQEKLQKRSPIHLPRREGVFYDEKERRALIPIKLNFPPMMAEKTEALNAALGRVCGPKENCDRWNLLGAHGATLQNQHQVRDDFSRVTVLGLVLLVVGLGSLALLGRGKLLLIAPIVGVAVAVSAGLTHWLFGGIHGLTLSFGSGIIGLALDYGFHRALNPQGYVARSNLFGLLTTVGVLVVLMASQIPLVRQIMFFSAVGISTAFLLIWVAYEGLGWFSKIPGFALAPRPHFAKLGFVAALMAGVPVGFFVLHPQFDLARFNFETARERELMLWLVKQTNLSPPLFIVDKEGTGSERLERAAKTMKWADRKLRVENVASYLPLLSDQTRNLESWTGTPCTDKGPIFNFQKTVSRDQQTFFSPFFENFNCERLTPRADGDLPIYVADFTAHGRWLTLFFPSSPEELRSVKTNYPTATSLKEVVQFFPETLSAEMRWMVPAAMLLICGLLWIYYRRWELALISLVPFLTGVGFFVWLALLFHLDVSFVTLVGLVMLCGLSVDYGIFATDAARFPPNPATPGAWTAILFASLATLSGFVPLLLCRHQVLFQLGQVLSAGTFGTILGAFWGVPLLARKFQTAGGA